MINNKKYNESYLKSCPNNKKNSTINLIKNEIQRAKL